MQKKSSQSTAVNAGFILCLFLICTVSAVAYYALHMCEQRCRFTRQISANQFLSEQTLRQFGAAQIAALHFRETNDPEFMKMMQQLFKEVDACMEAMNERFHSEVNLKRAKELMKLYDEFRQTCHEEAAISEQIELVKKKEEPEQEKELAVLYNNQRQIRTEQDKIAAEVNKCGMELRVMLEKYRRESTYETERTFALSRTMLLTTSILAVILGLVVGFVVASIVRRDPAHVDTDYDAVSGPEPSGDLRLVADRLQEVVNLLRKWGGKVDNDVVKTQTEVKRSFSSERFSTRWRALSSIRLPKPRAFMPLLSFENKGIRAQ